MNLSIQQSLVITTLVLISISGCTNSKQPTVDNEPGTPSAETDHTEHNHPSEGPHHGPLIELGSEEFHAELIHDEEAQTVTIFVLDSTAKIAVPIADTEIMINLKHEGEGKQFPLNASPLEGEEAGASSRFVSESKELGDLLHNESAEPILVILINGKSYRGHVPHAHGH